MTLAVAQAISTLNAATAAAIAVGIGQTCAGIIAALQTDVNAVVSLMTAAGMNVSHEKYLYELAASYQAVVVYLAANFSSH